MKFTHFEKHQELVYGISEKKDGDMKYNNENRENFFSNLSVSENSIIRAGLINGTNVARVFKDGEKNIPETDGLVTDEKEILLTITMADCFPIYFFDPNKKVIGIAHAGWRGITGGTIKNTIEKMNNEFGANPENILIGIGPGIQKCHFEIGKEVLFNFEKYPEAILKKDGKIFVELEKIIFIKLLQNGILEKNIEASGECTFCESEKYFSARRERKEKLDAMLGYIGLKF